MQQLGPEIESAHLQMMAIQLKRRQGIILIFIFAIFNNQSRALDNRDFAFGTGSV